MNYDEMSDFEINKAVAKLKYNHPSDPEYFKFYRLNNGSVVQVNAYKMWPQDLDFCNNPSDAWPIIVSNNICIQWYDDCHGIYASASMATSDESNNSFISDDENPLRAAMICFLKMKDAES
jgi:hypothetical protein